jgi:hypothetical protein
MNFIRWFFGLEEARHIFFVENAGTARLGPSAEITRPYPPTRGSCPRLNRQRRAGRRHSGCRGHRRRPALGGIAARRLARSPRQRRFRRRFLRRSCGAPRRKHGIGVVVPARTRSLWTGAGPLWSRSPTLDRGPRARRQGCPVGHGGGFAFGRPRRGPGRTQGACADCPTTPATSRRDRRRDGSFAAPRRCQDSAGNGPYTVAHRPRPRHRRRPPLAGGTRALPRRYARGLACGVAQ